MCEAPQCGGASKATGDGDPTRVEPVRVWGEGGADEKGETGRDWNDGESNEEPESEATEETSTGELRPEEPKSGDSVIGAVADSPRSLSSGSKGGVALEGEYGDGESHANEEDGGKGGR